jgi:hypothetical protein
MGVLRDQFRWKVAFVAWRSLAMILKTVCELMYTTNRPSDEGEC